jgi:UDP-N-acetylglucosamine--N-acetylmuramyl-(pentapeptide) pyrophosphoryl-undecaprenol N-acetylglucosamine transferase
MIAAGGSGGHLIPAQVVAGELMGAGVQPAFAAFGLSTNPFFDRSAWTYHEIASAAPSLRRLCAFAGRNVQGMAQALALLRRERPALVVGFGSYHVLPILSAAVLLRIPLVMYAADVVPGRVIRLFSPFAAWTGCCCPEASERLFGATYVVAPPIRSDLLHPTTREEGRAYFGLPTTPRAILVVGGSQGAAVLNTLLPQVFDHMDRSTVVIHLAGPAADITAVVQSYACRGVTAVVRPYEPKMRFAYAAADVVVARAGRSVIAEIEACQKRAVYIPYPYAKDNHQQRNATLAARRGNASVVDESTATPQTLAAHIEQMLARAMAPQNGHERRREVESFVHKIVDTLDEVLICQKMR